MSKYQSKPVNSDGSVAWSKSEDKAWSELYLRQLPLVKSRACQAYIDGLSMLNLPIDSVPQIKNINKELMTQTGWRLAPVPALISFDRFFELLADKQFPVATFLRTKEEFDYLQEPDFFHEVFGHCAMLTNPDFAHFTHIYGTLGKHASHTQRVYLARLYWFTVEFGLVKENGVTKIYGGGILSSPGETIYALDDRKPIHADFSVIDVLRTPYRIDIMQPIYYVLEDLKQLYHLSQDDLINAVNLAMELDLFPALFEPKEISNVK
ncbi:phenylalanine 4-monooxygenase [Vibrio sp. ZSDE26]|uniref:Phenylalanine-4-hydroxylase n=1 Tax=Vibrio amylolyticus TaxID=2847292 RepID=A0A9X2BJ38_9VIBR|nr:phenylalanine 4-monooxygenase [Vibrio amylolyticus]MCK6265701.1 phenylalanine 4-monooxygenase [Vibrio amylolyticus]